MYAKQKNVNKERNTHDMTHFYNWSPVIVCIYKHLFLLTQYFFDLQKAPH